MFLYVVVVPEGNLVTVWPYTTEAGARAAAAALPSASLEVFPVFGREHSLLTPGRPVWCVLSDVDGQLSIDVFFTHAQAYAAEGLLMGVQGDRCRYLDTVWLQPAVLDAVPPCCAQQEA